MEHRNTVMFQIKNIKLHIVTDNKSESSATFVSTLFKVLLEETHDQEWGTGVRGLFSLVLSTWWFIGLPSSWIDVLGVFDLPICFCHCECWHLAVLNCCPELPSWNAVLIAVVNPAHRGLSVLLRTPDTIQVALRYAPKHKSHFGTHIQKSHFGTHTDIRLLRQLLFLELYTRHSQKSRCRRSTSPNIKSHFGTHIQKSHFGTHTDIRLLWQLLFLMNSIPVTHKRVATEDRQVPTWAVSSTSMNSLLFTHGRTAPDTPIIYYFNCIYLFNFLMV